MMMGGAGGGAGGSSEKKKGFRIGGYPVPTFEEEPEPELPSKASRAGSRYPKQQE
jgi:hypothetical protein